MNKSLIWIVGLALILLSALVVLMFRDQPNKVNWYVNFRENDDQPYGLHVMSQLLDDYFPEKSYSVHRNPLKKDLPTDSAQKHTYVFVGAALYLGDDDLERLLQFVRIGNDAFISANDFPSSLLDELFPDHYYGDQLLYEEKMAVYLNFTHPQLKETAGYTCDFIYDWENNDYDWMYFYDSLLYNMVQRQVALGFFDDQKINFIKVPLGKGNFFLHTTPLMFTNYNLKNERNFEYANKVFSHLSGSDIYWDEFNKVPQYHRNVGNNETPLRYVLSKPSLRWAWYVLLGMVFLFLLFRIKRDQQIIPVLEQNTNTSLEFIQTIGRLYFLQNDHRKLALQKMKLFLGFIRSRYALQTKELDEAFVNKLSEKSQIAKSKITGILEQYKTIDNMYDITQNQLEQFHHDLKEFYKTCK